MIDLYSLAPMICVIFIYLCSILLGVYIKNDINRAHFAWIGGVALIAIYTLVAKRLEIIMIAGIFIGLIAYIYKPSHRDNMLGRFAQRNKWFLPMVQSIVILSAYRQFLFRDMTRQLLITLLTCFWASHMIIHLFFIYANKNQRFTIMWKKSEKIKALILSVAYIFCPQLLFMLIMSIPIIIININKGPELNLFDYIGVALFVIGFFFKSVSDYQLFKFKKDPVNEEEIMTLGLWRYSRHPNYFGEIILWLGMACFTLSIPGGWIAFVSPATIAILLTIIIYFDEKQLAANQNFFDYKKHTSTIVPWFVKK